MQHLVIFLLVVSEKKMFKEIGAERANINSHVTKMSLGAKG